MEIQVTHLTSSNISIRSETDYREAGSVNAVLRCLKAGSGFIHLAPFGSGKLEVEELKRFHQLPATLRGLLEAPDVKAFWLVALWKDRTISKSNGHHSETQASAPPGETSEAVAYSWLFMQPPNVLDEAWRHASKAFSETSGQAVIHRSGGEPAVLAYADSEQRALTCVSAEEVLQAIAANAMPVAWVQLSSERSISGLQPAVRPFSLYAAVPHCNSSRMTFACRGIYKGGE